MTDFHPEDVDRSGRAATRAATDLLRAGTNHQRWQHACLNRVRASINQRSHIYLTETALQQQARASFAKQASIRAVQQCVAVLVQQHDVGPRPTRQTTEQDHRHVKAAHLLVHNKDEIK